MGEGWLKTRGVCLPSPDPDRHLRLPRQGCATQVRRPEHRTAHQERERKPLQTL